MPLLFCEKYGDGDEVQVRAVEDGCDITVPVTLRDGSRKIIIAFAPVESSFSYVMHTDFDGHVPEPEELAEICHDHNNLRALMIPGGKHEVPLRQEPDAPSALVIRHLGDRAMDQPQPWL